jgi:hypothetical protein
LAPDFNYTIKVPKFLPLFLGTTLAKLWDALKGLKGCRVIPEKYPESFPTCVIGDYGG